jgi:hypothetical protein
VITITAPDSEAVRFVVEAKTSLNPRDAVYAVEQARSWQEWLSAADTGPSPRILVVAPFISPRTRELLVERGASYADAAGNLRLWSDRPAMLIDARGSASSPWRDSRVRETSTLRGKPAARVVRALCDWRPPVKATDLAVRADTSAGATYRVLDLLDREALIARRGKGEVVEVDWPGLLQRWSEDYGFAERNRVETFIAARGLPNLLEELGAFSDLRYVVTGSLAAAAVAEYAEARLGAVYVDDISEVAEKLGLKPATGGANFVLAEPFDEVVYQRATARKGIRYAALTQAVVDLLTGPGRNPAEGEELLRWMRENEDAWRL